MASIDRPTDHQPAIICVGPASVNPGIRTSGYTPQYPVIYLCEDVRGEVLYVGQTCDWWPRRGTHRINSEWWPRVRKIHLIHQPSLAQRRADEACLLRMLQPPFNYEGTFRDMRKGRVGHTAAMASSSSVSVAERVAELEFELACLRRHLAA